MKVKFLTTTNDANHPGHQQLIRSLKHFGYDFHVIIHPWAGFGDKMIKTYEYLKEHPEIEFFVYTDAWDTFALAPMEEIVEKITDWDCIFIGPEKACYPHSELSELYPPCDTPWKYVNGGNWLGSSKRFIEMIEREGTTPEENDQVYQTRQFLFNNKEKFIRLDYECKVFQTTGFEHEGDFSIDPETGRIRNNITWQSPVLFHGNGRTNMDWIYAILP